jgi:clan AA aspartic protease
MGLTYADIELINADDIALAKRHIIGQEEIKRLNINILVDTGAYNLCINESIQAQLELPFIEKRKGQLANGSIEEYDFVGPVVLKFKNRQTVCNALVMQGDNEPLLGAIPLEDMPAPPVRIPCIKLI